MKTYVSLFSGIGGGCVALEAFGYQPAAQVEWNEHCRAHLARHWPEVPRWGDVREFTARGFFDRTGWRGRPDVLFGGGFPCQSVSTAGRRRAQADARWMWPEVVRIADELRPRFIVLENVRGLLSAGDPYGSAFAEVLGTLAELGFSSRWGVVRASDVGAPHQRARLFLVANASGVRREWRRRSRFWGTRLADGHPADGSPARWGKHAPAIRRWERLMMGPAPEPLEGGRLSADFVEWMMGFPAGWVSGTRGERIRSLGNSAVPLAASYAFARLGLEAA